jgi:hypothetical protein
MARIFFPTTTGSTAPDFLIFSAIILDPASPNPTAKSDPILTIIFYN